MICLPGLRKLLFQPVTFLKIIDSGRLIVDTVSKSNLGCSPGLG